MSADSIEAKYSVRCCADFRTGSEFQLQDVSFSQKGTEATINWLWPAYPYSRLAFVEEAEKEGKWKVPRGAQRISNSGMDSLGAFLT